MAIRTEHIACPSDTHLTYAVAFFNRTIHCWVTKDPATVAKWISDTEWFHNRRLHKLIVGLDVEWRPSFSDHDQSPVATIQICVGSRCLIYQILNSEFIPNCLGDFLTKGYTFVGVNIKEDLNKLQRDYGFGAYAKHADLRVVATNAYKRQDIMYMGLRRLADLVLRKEVEKPRSVTISEWDAPRLTAAQVQYACLDAYMSFEIGRVLDAEFGWLSNTSQY